MSIEEKAKRYDELIKRLNKAREDVGGYTFKSVYDEVMSELAESEDERIREVLIDYFNRYKEQEECGVKTFYGIPTDNILAWLKPINKPRAPWKPSEEMLEALYRVISEDVMEKSEDEMLLDKLYQGLKYGKVLSEK